MLTFPMEAAFFDLDKTVIAKSSVLAFGRPLYREGLLSRSALLKSAYNQAIYRMRGADETRMERARDKMLSITRGWEQARVSGIVRETFENIVAPIIYAEALELFEEHLDAGRKIFLVSSAPIEIVSHLAEYLGIDECIASRSRIDADGRYTGELDFYAYGPHKATAIREAAERDGVDLSRSYAYSDSVTDAPMLEMVGHPGGGQSRPGAGPAGSPEGVGDPGVRPARQAPPAGPDARPGPHRGGGRGSRRRRPWCRRMALGAAAPGVLGGAHLLLGDNGAEGEHDHEQHELLHQTSGGAW
jgi:HAD superfamily hydrolase (TIGR01490 family)